MGRVVLPNYPLHIVQRGHNRQVVFAGEEDYQRYLTDLKELKETFDVRLYAYCLMTNHVHLLVEPGELVSSLGQMMKALAARATRYRNKLEGRSGTLWESRYKSSLVQSDTYLLACCRYIELNPVRARMVEHPTHYPWSSYRARIGDEAGEWLDPAPSFLALAETDAERSSRYIDFVSGAIPDAELRLIREAVQCGQLTGSNRFVEEIERIAGIRIEHRGQGRPMKEK